jgi:uncharacterized protein (DUF2164 family)
VNRASM